VKSLAADVRDAIRVLVRERRFAPIATLTLALGVGAVTAIFSVVNGVLLKPLPLPDADRLVNVWSHAPRLGYDQFPLSPDLFFYYEQHNQVFESMAMFDDARANLTGAGSGPEVVQIARTTHGYFPTLGVPFSRGRSYGASEDVPGAPRVAVMSHRFWRQRFAADASIVGRTIQLDGEPTEVVGVASAAVDRQGSPDLYVPARFNRDTPPQGSFGWNGIARLKPGVTADDASAHLAPLVMKLMDALNSPTYRAFIVEGGYQPRVRSMSEDEVGELERPLWILLGTVSLLLLIACANVANLFLIRADGRQRELAVRAALGAGRGALVRRLLVESLVVATAGGAVGLLVAGLALPALLRLAPPSIPRLDRISIDATVVLFTLGAVAVSALAIGLLPALRYTRANTAAALRQGGRGGTDDARRRRGRDALVVVQTALALVLLVSSGLLLRSFSRLLSTDPGFDPAHLMTFRIALPERDYTDGAAAMQFHEALLARLAAVPGVQAVGATSVVPVAQAAPGSAYAFEDQPVAPGQLPPMVHYKVATPGYFPTMGMRVRRGRGFDSRDAAAGVRHVIVNAALAERYWPGQDPIGRRVRLAGGSGGRDDAAAPVFWFTVIGVVDNELQDGLRRPPRPLLYYPLNRTLEGAAPDVAAQRVFDFVVRGPAVTASALREAVWSLDRNLPLASLRSMDEIIGRSIVEFTFTMLTLAIAAGVALALGAIGLYGALSYAVTLRTPEIGVRLALGAPPARVMRSVVAHGAAIAGIGLVLGAAAAAGLTRFLGALLFDTAPLDLATFAGTSLALLIVALIASYLPARRAAAVSPLTAMTGE
jgi:predicted permease